jgi:acetyl-CoA carboxylase carboxyltransferase component
MIERPMTDALKPPSSDSPAESLLRSHLDKNSAEFIANAKAMETLVEAVRADQQRLCQGGGARAIERQHKKGRLTARERIEQLVDPDTEFFELGQFAAYGMYEEWGTPAAAGVVAGVGRVASRLFMIIANDATVKAGAFFPMTCKKVIRCQRIALENHLPVLYLVDSAGVFLPLQDEIFPDEDDFGRVFRHNAVLSAQGTPQIAAIMGMCVAGGAYLPVMCDTLLMTEGSGLFLAGPALVRAAIGQKVSADELGGPKMHAEVSGTVDFHEPDDPSCLARMRRLADKLGPRPQATFDQIDSSEPLYDAQELNGIVPEDPVREYEIREVITRLVDRSEFEEYRPHYGATIVCGFARIGGYAVGIVANQKCHMRPADGPMEFGGVIYAKSAEKAARFILDCNQNRIALLFLQDVNGFMVGRDAERSGIIRAGAKMVNAVSNSVVPKITVILGGSFGAGHYAMCGKAYDPRFLFCWPTARYAVMGGAQAANTLLDLKIAQLKKKGEEPTEEQVSSYRKEIETRYAEALDPRYAAARLWVDRILEPADTREAIRLSLEVAAHNPDLPALRTGVYQS